MEDIKEFLKSIGLGKNESQIYIELIKNGLSDVSQISRLTNIHRSNIYEATKELIKKGLIYEVIREKKKYYYARQAQSLLDYLKNKEIELKEVINKINEKNVETQKQTEVFITKGMFALKETLMNLLRHMEPILIYGIPKDFQERMGPFLREFHKERISKKVLLKSIHNKEAIDRILVLNRMDFTESRHLPSKYDSAVTTVLCQERVILITWHKDVSIIEIRDSEIAEAYKNYFQILWKTSKEV